MFQTLLSDAFLKSKYELGTVYELEKPFLFLYFV